MMWLTSLALTVVLVTVVVAQGEIWEDDDREILIRSQRGAKNRDKRKLFSSHAFLKLHPHADSDFIVLIHSFRICRTFLAYGISYHDVWQRRQ